MLCVHRRQNIQLKLVKFLRYLFCEENEISPQDLDIKFFILKSNYTLKCSGLKDSWRNEI